MRDDTHKLVGMACIAGNLRHAVLSDLCVDPRHQKEGIGEATVSMEYNAINELGISYVYTELAKTNPFKDKMLASGFRITGDSLFCDVNN